MSNGNVGFLWRRHLLVVHKFKLTLCKIAQSLPGESLIATHRLILKLVGETTKAFLFGSGFRPTLSIYVRPKLFYELLKKKKEGKKKVLPIIRCRWKKIK
jgi:hypothetical protein